jgi:hypothetical protein
MQLVESRVRRMSLAAAVFVMLDLGVIVCRCSFRWTSVGAFWDLP